MTNTDYDNSREWAAQAYALLKKQQEKKQDYRNKKSRNKNYRTRSRKQELQKQEEQKARITETRRAEQELQKQEEQKQNYRNRSKNLLILLVKKSLLDPKNLDEPKLGEFDDNFTWSAMILAAQGKEINQISLDEIDWLTKLRRGLEETEKDLLLNYWINWEMILLLLNLSTI